MEDDDRPRVPQGDWPERFPLHPAGFSYKCKGRNVKKATKKPNKSPVVTTHPVTVPIRQQPLHDNPIGSDVVTEAPVTTPKVTPHAPTTHLATTTLKHTLTTKEVATKPPQTATTFWIRTPTPPNAVAKVNPKNPDYKLGDPLLVTVPIKNPFAPDAALDPLDASLGSDDFDIKTVGTPKPPRAVVDPDA